MPQRPQGIEAVGCGQPHGRVNKRAEPSAERWMNRPLRGDDPSMAHLMNAFSATILIYAAFTRGGLLVARGLTYLAGKTG
jgi:hypothetical protein